MEALLLEFQAISNVGQMGFIIPDKFCWFVINIKRYFVYHNFLQSAARLSALFISMATKVLY
ncbi:hypothetical protein FD09_GL002605 [Schleiferilactobacillus perolens DSM 12744]|uniref:Uncharacterized protein n=1 Tax=Schleiferilactobacillus perolens DSM 12744 TaxID=1423792 RepID=A0A0R1N9K0_9LACO|nr:hypothetical protein FD09_GL002605 [Schleiferilactobacillus perolens DSM 12744]